MYNPQTVVHRGGKPAKLVGRITKFLMDFDGCAAIVGTDCGHLVRVSDHGTVTILHASLFLERYIMQLALAPEFATVSVAGTSKGEVA